MWIQYFSLDRMDTVDIVMECLAVKCFKRLETCLQTSDIAIPLGATSSVEQKIYMYQMLSQRAV